MRTAQLPLYKIRIDGGTQPREAIDDATVAEYAEAIKAGATFPPAVVFHDGTDYWLADGFHRRSAHAAAGLDEMPVEVRQGTQRDAILYSVGANADHGIRRTNADKRRAVQRLLDDAEWSTWSDREIARRCGVTHEVVSRLRPASSLAENASQKAYTTRHGTTATMNTANIGRSNGQRRSTSDAQPSYDDDAQSEAGEPAVAVLEDDEPSEPSEQTVTNGHANRFELQGEPSPPPVNSARFVDRFSSAVRAIYNQFNMLGQAGGIEAMVKEWSREDAAQALKTLKDIRERCDDAIPKIKRSLKCKSA